MKNLVSKDVIHLQEITEDFFEDEIQHKDDNIWKNDVAVDTLSDMFKAVLIATKDVIDKQYKWYYEMEVSDKMRQNLSSERTHNINSE